MQGEAARFQWLAQFETVGLPVMGVSFVIAAPRFETSAALAAELKREAHIPHYRSVVVLLEDIADLLFG